MDSDEKSPGSKALETLGRTEPNGSAASAGPGEVAAASVHAAATVSPGGVPDQAGPVAKESPNDPPPPGAARPAEGATIAPPFTPAAAPEEPTLTPDTPRSTDPEKPFLVDQPPQPSLAPTAAKVLDPTVDTAAAVHDPDQRVTIQNAEVKLGVTAAELAESALAKTSPIGDVVHSAELLGHKIETEVEATIPHPTLPHVFAATGRMYNDSLALIQSLEVHVATLRDEGEAEMHAIAQRLQTLIGDFKSGVENIEASMTQGARAAIDALHKV